MNGRKGRRLALSGLAGLLAVTGVLPGLTGVAFAAIGDVVHFVDATQWVPDAPGLSGVAYRASNNSLVVVDMQNHDFSGFDGTNLWEYDLDTNTVASTGSVLPNPLTQDPTGVAINPGATTSPNDDILFLTSDSTMTVYVIEPGADGTFGTNDPAPRTLDATGDVEDPAYNPVNGHLYVLAGSGIITDYAPGVDLLFGTVDDPEPNQFAIPVNDNGDPLDDVEALAFDPATGNLLAAHRFDNIMYEFTTGGVFVQDHDLTTVPISSLSGLTVQPDPGPLPDTYWLAERGSDSTTVSDGALYRITLGPAPDFPNNAPVLAPLATPIAASQGVQVTFDANASDIDFGQTLTYSLQAGGPTGDSINPSTGVYTWPSPPAGSATARVIVTDNGTTPGVLTDFQDVVINVGSVNAPPVIQGSGTFAPLHNEGDNVSFDFSATDPDGPSQTWSAMGLPPGLQMVAATGTVTGTVAAGAAAGSPYNVTVTVTDGTTPDSEVMQWTIVNTNPHAPVLANITNKTVVRGNQLTFNATATDADGDAREFSLVNPPSGATITESGQFKWTPNVSPGNYNVTIKVSDTGTPVRTDQQTFVVTVQDDSNPDPIDTFSDDDGSVFEASIEWLAAEGITQGCNPPVNDRFCPEDDVSRGEMAAFLVRAMSYPATNVDYFTDDEASVFEGSINRLREAGVTLGCNPPNFSRYCPSGLVTRGQMAAFLVRALDLPAYNGPDRFVDDNGHVFEGAIERLAQAGITVGCNPPVNDRFCPNDFVTRGQMAAFLKRALD